MTQNEKDLMLKDLCARLLYGVKIHTTDGNVVTLIGINLPNHYSTINGVYSFDCYPMKPYLFPLSSMTEEQKKEYIELQEKVIYNVQGLINLDVMKYIDWCYKHHIDYRGLIEEGLAIDATGLNIY